MRSSKSTAMIKAIYSKIIIDFYDIINNNSLLLIQENVEELL